MESSFERRTILTILQRTEDKDPSSKQTHKQFNIKIKPDADGLDAIGVGRHIRISKRPGSYIGINNNRFYISSLESSLSRENSKDRTKAKTQDGSEPATPISRRGSLKK